MADMHRFSSRCCRVYSLTRDKNWLTQLIISAVLSEAQMVRGAPRPF